MKLNKIWMFALFAFLLVPTIVYAQPPSFQEGGEALVEGILVEYGKFGYLSQNDSFAFNFHAVNISTGTILTSASVSCELDVYNRTGGHIFINKDIAFDSFSRDFETIVTADNFTALGDYAFITHCNDSRIGGFSSTPMFVTVDGNEVDRDMMANLPLAMVVTFIGSAWIIFLIGHSFKEEDQKWYHLMFRSIFYMVSIGFLAFSIGGLNRIASGVKSSSSLYFTPITSAVNLISKTQFVFFVLVLMIAIMAIIFNVLQYQKRKKNPLDLET